MNIAIFQTFQMQVSCVWPWWPRNSQLGWNKWFNAFNTYINHKWSDTAIKHNYINSVNRADGLQSSHTTSRTDCSMRSMETMVVLVQLWTGRTPQSYFLRRVLVSWFRADLFGFSGTHSDRWAKRQHSVTNSTKWANDPGPQTIGRPISLQ